MHPLILMHAGRSLVELHLDFGRLSVVNLNPMPMLTSLTLELTILEDQHLTELNTCFPNLQVLNLVGVRELKDPKIHLLNLQTCHVVVYDYPPSLTLITPKLITLKIECFVPVAIHVEAPMLSDFHLSLNTIKHVVAFSPKTFEKLKTLWLGCLYTGSLLSEFPTTKTVETLTLDSRNHEPRDARDSKLTIRKVFTVFPNVSSLCIYSGAWSELEACLNAEDWEILDGRKGLKTICAYLDLVDPSLTFSSVCRVLDQCVGLTDVSLLIRRI
ncbi:putative F-box protein AUF1 [Helianthus annuus]|nr:putative F-box protein AUF1 [Helianthus annuus]